MPNRPAAPHGASCQAVEGDGPRVGAFGWDGGFGTTLLVDPVRDLVEVVRTQQLYSSPVAPLHPGHRGAPFDALPDRARVG